MLKKLISRIPHISTKSLPIKRIIFREFLYLFISTGVFQISNLALNILSARFLGPIDYGDWNAYMLIVIYISYLQLGLINGMNRDIPLYTGAGNHEKVEVIQSTALGGLVIATVLGGLILWFFPPIWISGTANRLGLRTTALYLVVLQAFMYVSTYLRSRKKFIIFSYQQLLLGLGYIIIAIPLASIGRVEGILIGIILARLIALIIPFNKTEIPLQFSFSIEEWKALIRIGFPIMIVGLGYTYLTTIDRWVILRFLGPEELGYYSLFVRLVSVLPIITALIANQTYPRAAEKYGRTRTAHSLLPLLKRQVIATLGITILVGGILIIAVPPFVQIFLPNYSIALKIFPKLLFGMSILAQCGVFGVFLNIIDKQIPYMVVQILSILIGLVLNIFFVKLEMGLNGVATASVITYSIYLFLLVFLSFVVYGQITSVSEK